MKLGFVMKRGCRLAAARGEIGMQLAMKLCAIASVGSANDRKCTASARTKRAIVQQKSQLKEKEAGYMKERRHSNEIRWDM